MPVSEQLQPLTPGHAPSDPNVTLPEHVRTAGAAADELHKQLYTPPAEPVVEDPPVVPAVPAADPNAPQPGPTPPPAQAQPVPEQHPAPSEADKDVTAEEWRHRFLSMQGRFTAAQRTIGSMEHQMTELGQELVRTQNMLAQGPQPAAGAEPARIDPNHNNLITNEDRENYGDELIDLATRVARGAVGGEIDSLREENKRLTQRVQTTGKRELFTHLDTKLPQWRAINKSPQFLSWLRLPNIYTGQLRGNMLKAAVEGAEAPKVLALFSDFLAEVAATGAHAQPQPDEQQGNQPAPRTPAVSLEALAAPGKARPASGDSQVPSEKPIYSRAAISKFYDEKRRGMWAGREAEADAYEADIIAAQGQGRIRQ